MSFINGKVSRRKKGSEKSMIRCEFKSKADPKWEKDWPEFLEKLKKLLDQYGIKYDITGSVSSLRSK